MSSILQCVGTHSLFSESRPILLTTIFVLSSGCFVFDEYTEPGPCSWPDPSRNAKSCNNPIDIAAGGSHSCLVRANNSAWCWGANNHGQLGVFLQDGRQVVASHIPLRVPFPEDAAVTAIATGEDHTCAISNGKLYCWGSNAFGQCGLSVNDTTQGDILQPLEVPGSNSNTWRAVTAGDRHTCAIDTENNVYCWGDNRLRQVDSTSGNDFIITPTQIALRDNIQSIHAGADFTCAEDSYDVICWGNARFGKTGREYDDVTQTFAGQDPYRVTTDYGKKIESLSTGSNHACVVYVSGQVYCWGSADNGRLGVKTQTSTVHIPGLVPVRATAVNNGRIHTCVLDNQGRVQCWGGNRNYQLGDGTEVDRFLPQPIAGAVDKVTKIAVGHEHACSLEENGRVQCWGLNEWGQSGQAWIEGSSESNRSVKQPSPITLPDPKNKEDNGLDGGVRVYPDAEANPDGTVLIPDSRDADIASEDAGGMTNPDTGSMQRDAGMGNMDAASMGNMDASNVDAGSMNNPDASAPDSGPADSGLPSVLPDLNGNMMIATGDSHACVVRDHPNAATSTSVPAQQVYCWGQIFDPRDPSNNMTRTATPTEVDISHTTLTGTITDIQAGFGFTCIQTSGAPGAQAMGEFGPSVYCWGRKSGSSYMRPNRSVTYHNVIKNTGSNDAYEVYDLKVADNEDTYVVGRFSGDLDTPCGMLSSGSSNQYDGFLIKYSGASVMGTPEQANCDWAVQFQSRAIMNDSAFGGGTERILTLDTDANGDVYIAGAIPTGNNTDIQFESAVNRGNPCPTIHTANDNANAFVAKYSSDGTCQWSTFFKGNSGQTIERSAVTDLVVDTDLNRLWVMGYFTRSLRFDDQDAPMTPPHLDPLDPADLERQTFLAVFTTTTATPQYQWSTALAESSTGRDIVDTNGTGPTLSYLLSNGLALDPWGNVWVGGLYTNERASNGTTVYAEQTATNGPGFIQNEVGLYAFKFNAFTYAMGPEAVFLNAFGTAANPPTDYADFGAITAIDVDSFGNAYLVGNVGTEINITKDGTSLREFAPFNSDSSEGLIMKLNPFNSGTGANAIVEWAESTIHSFLTPSLNHKHSINDIVIDDAHDRLFIVGETDRYAPFSNVYNTAGDQQGFLIEVHLGASQIFYDSNRTRLFGGNATSGTTVIAEDYVTAVDLAPLDETVNNSYAHRDVAIAGMFNVGNPSSNSFPDPAIMTIDSEGASGYIEVEGANSAFIMQLQQPTQGDLRPVRMAFDNVERTGIRSLHVGDSHVCVHVDGNLQGEEVWCWGQAANGQLNGTQGADPVTFLPIPFPLKSNSFSFQDIQAVATGKFHTCVLGTKPTMPSEQIIRCVGDHSTRWGQCGYQPVTNGVSGGNTPVQSLAFTSGMELSPHAQNHTCVINADHSASCWGNYERGAIYSDGLPMSLSANTPIFASTQTTDPTQMYIKEIVAGADHTCVINGDNTASCWGSNEFGQLGRGPKTFAPNLYESFAPVALSDKPPPLLLENIRALSTKGNFTCAISREMGTEKVYCWGRNQVGQVGCAQSGIDAELPCEIILPSP